MGIFHDDNFKQVNGKWTALGYLKFDPTLGEVTMVPRGTFLDHLPGSDETEAQLGDGFALGYMTQRMNADGGPTVLEQAGYGTGPNGDYPIKVGEPVSIWRPDAGAEIEVEGNGDAGLGNLLATTGDGAVAADTPLHTPLSVRGGSIVVAQAGDHIMGILTQADLTPVSDESNVRIRFAWQTGGAIMTADMAVTTTTTTT